MRPDRYKLQSRCNFHLRPEQNLDPFDLFCSQCCGWVGRSVRLTSECILCLDTVEIVFSGNNTVQWPPYCSVATILFSGHHTLQRQQYCSVATILFSGNNSVQWPPYCSVATIVFSGNNTVQCTGTTGNIKRNEEFHTLLDLTSCWM
jgi:hypothetical protein